MKYFYHCMICDAGFWQETAIENNNIECIQCESSGHETVFNEMMGREIPKLHRIQVGTNEKGEIELPSYTYECQECGLEQNFYRAMKDLDTRKCSRCKADFHRLKQVWKTVPYVISDISHQEGRNGEDLDMSHVFGPGVRISSRKQLKEYKRLTRDAYFANTDKNNSVMRPVRNPDTGKVTMEKYTNKGKGIDLGEIHEVDETTVNKHAGAKDEKEWRELEKVAAAQVEVKE